MNLGPYKPCKVCELINNLKWDENIAYNFNTYLCNNFGTTFTAKQKNYLRLNFSLPNDDLFSITPYFVNLHIKNCLKYEKIAERIEEYQGNILTKEEIKDLLANFRDLPYDEKTNALINNWKEILFILMAQTRKNVEFNINNQSKHLLDSTDILHAKIITDTFKMMSIERFITPVVENKKIEDNTKTGIQKFKGKLHEIKALLEHNNFSN